VAENSQEAIEQERELGIDTLWRLAGRRVEADSSGDIESIAHQHGIGERKTYWAIWKIDIAAAHG
jgi:hypothetical protein